MEPARFDGAKWSIAPPDSGDLPRSLSVLTLNTWFKPDHRALRLAAQLAYLKTVQPDVIALQEVTFDLLEMLLDEDWVQARYAMPHAPARLLGDVGYGVLLLVRTPVQGFTWRPFDSSMGRGLLSVTLAGGMELGTVHLESMRHNTGPRAEQLAAATDWLVGTAPSMLVGDFNFDDNDEDAAPMGPWTDLWPVGQPHAPGWTADEVVNTMRRRPRAPQQRRIDRVLLHDRDRRWQLERIALVGTEALAKQVWMSDHFGILTHLRQRGG